MTALQAKLQRGGIVLGTLVLIGLCATGYQSLIAPRPERLTELYFTNMTYKPVRTEPDVPFPVAFTIRNGEHRTTHYRYTVIARASAKQYVLRKGSIRLRDSHARATTLQVTSPTPRQRTNITVRLQYAGIPRGSDVATTEIQDIHFWIDNSKGGS